MFIVAAILTSIPLSASEPPNIVIVMCDDMGFSDVGSYGGEIETPMLDELASNGLRFRNFYNNAKCEHTRASLLTGRWWHHVGASASVHYAAETFGTRMQRAGYRTLMAGKWHAGQRPTQRGFDRYYGLTDGCCNYWNPGVAIADAPEPARKKLRRWAIDDWETLPYTPTDTDFYTTDAFTDAAIGFLDEADAHPDWADKPVLLYLAYTAPHYPLHASESDVQKYRGKYSALGWDELRRERFSRQQQLGILPSGAVLSPRDPDVPAWETIPSDQRDHWDLRMATYAAMIDRMDRQISRVVANLRTSGRWENTLLLFFSDNGACEDSSDRSTVEGSMPWEVTSYMTQGINWANASNTPYRQYKTTTLEGGTRTPLIVHWPGHVAAGEKTDQVSHLVDIMPTLLEVAQQPTDSELPGISLVRTFEGSRAEQRPPIYWEFGKYKSMRDGDWKWIVFKNQPAQLYDLAADPTECVNVAEKHPERVVEMERQWKQWRQTKM